MSESEAIRAVEAVPLLTRMRAWRMALSPMELAALETMLRLGAQLESALAVCIAIRAESAGHSFAYLQDFAGEVALLREVDEPLRWPDAHDWLSALGQCKLCADAGVVPGWALRDAYAQHGKPLVFGTQADGRVRVYLHRFWFGELDLAQRLWQHVATRDVANAVETSDATPWLVQALAALQQRHLFILTGGPGTGKTTAAARLLLSASVAWRAQQHALPRVLLCAPTGKAAARLAEAFRAQLLSLETEFPHLADVLAHLQAADSQTLHRVLGFRAGQFFHGPHRPLECDLLLVDEASMLSLSLTHALLAALTPRQQLILLGDGEQLSAVEIGTPFVDLIHAAAQAPLAMTLLRLNRQWRADAELFALAQAIRERRCDVSVLQKVLWQPPACTWPAPMAGPEQTQNERAKLQTVFLQEQVLQGYWDTLLKAPDLASAWQHSNDQRVLCALHEGPAGRLHANAVIERTLRLHYRLGNSASFRARLMMATRNDYRIGVMNGDIGLCWPDQTGRLMLWFERAASAEAIALAGEKITLPGGQVLTALAPEHLPDAVPAFALTVHKSQGSEFGRVALLLPSQDSPVLHRALLYTAITRAKSALSICAPEEIVLAALQREPIRHSGLRDYLQQA